MFQELHNYEIVHNSQSIQLPISFDHSSAIFIRGIDNTMHKSVLYSHCSRRCGYGGDVRPARSVDAGRGVRV